MGVMVLIFGRSYSIWNLDGTLNDFRYSELKLEVFGGNLINNVTPEENDLQL